ncbi:dihydrofolate reductase family protein [Streptomyces sp. GD-15H]
MESCVARAKAAAGDRDVMLHGASTAQACLRAGVLDELETHFVPVRLGEGRRLSDGLGRDRIEHEPVRQPGARDVTHLRYRVVRPAVGNGDEFSGRAGPTPATAVRDSRNAGGNEEM